SHTREECERKKQRKARGAHEGSGPDPGTNDERQINGTVNDANILAALTGTWEHLHRQVNITRQVGSKTCPKESGSNKQTSPGGQHNEDQKSQCHDQCSP